MNKIKKYQKCFDVVFTTLMDDKELYFVWQSNIAMNFVDELGEKGFRLPGLNEMANAAAKNFLNLLIDKVKK